MNSIISLQSWSAAMVYGPEQVERIRRLTNLLHPGLEPGELLQRQNLLEQVEVIFSGWGGPVLDGPLLEKAPNLKLFLYAGGAWSGIVSPAWYESDVILSSSVSLNAIPVAEYTLGFILLGLKRAIPIAEWVRKERDYPKVKYSPGNYRSTVGLVALGHAARHLVRFLQAFDLRIIAFDPYADPEWAIRNNVELVGLETLFQSADVVSVHLPVNRETKGMIKGCHLRMMKELATFINTSRGRVLEEDDVLEALRDREDIHAIFDVAIKEPPEPSSPFFTLPNVILTPHIAGSLFRECERMSNAMIEEYERYRAGEPLLYEVERIPAGMGK